jgi:ankyrin repeat protein
MTPLHLAVMSGNGRIVKKLLLKGCDRNIRAYNNKLPLGHRKIERVQKYFRHDHRQARHRVTDEY